MVKRVSPDMERGVHVSGHDTQPEVEAAGDDYRRQKGVRPGVSRRDGRTMTGETLSFPREGGSRRFIVINGTTHLKVVGDLH